MTKLSVTVLLVIMLAAFTAGIAQATPSTDGWTLDVSCSGSTVGLALAVDNLDELLVCPEVVEKTWENVALGSTGATLTKLVLGIDGDPNVNLNFWIAAGGSATNITMTSPLIAFAPINAEGTATAGVTVTDGDGVLGATAIGLFTGGKCYEASYNGPSNFAYLVSSPVVAPLDSSATNSESKPWQAMGTVYDISSQFQFNLSANDLASGTSSFRVRAIPEPGGCMALLSGLIGCAGFAVRRRRA